MRERQTPAVMGLRSLFLDASRNGARAGSGRNGSDTGGCDSIAVATCELVRCLDGNSRGQQVAQKCTVEGNGAQRGKAPDGPRIGLLGFET